MADSKKKSSQAQAALVSRLKKAAASRPEIRSAEGENNADVSATALSSSDVEHPEAAAPESMGVISFGTVSYNLLTDGTVETISGARVWNHGNRSVEFTVGALLDLGVVGPIPLVPGVNAILGPANTGKTPLLEFIAGQMNTEVIRAGEPFPGYIRETDALAGRMLSHTDPVMCVDSLKNITGRLHGGLMASGLSREFFTMLSDMSSFFAERNQAVVIVVNISSKDANVLDQAIESLSSNTTALWQLSTRGEVEWTVRSSAGKRRRSGVATINWAGDGVIRSLTSKSGDIAATNRVRPDISEPVSGHIPTTLSSVVSRVARHTTNETN